MGQIGIINQVFPVTSKVENKVRFLSCHGQTIPAYHLINMVRLVKRYEAIFNTPEHILNDLLFGMVVSYDQILKIYKAL